MPTSIRHCAFAAALILVASAASAQTRIQCHLDEQGRATAALIWQNTLGVERANAICLHSLAQSPAVAPEDAQQMPKGIERPGPAPAAPTTREQLMPLHGEAQRGAGRPEAALREAGREAPALSPRVYYGRFEQGVYDRAFAGIKPTQPSHASGNQPIGDPGRLLTPAGAAPSAVQRRLLPLEGDYVPLEQAGGLAGGGDAGYIAIW